MKKDFESGEIIFIDKPQGWTSFDVVKKIKNLIKKYTGKKVKVGHAGTLDPLATGLLILATGKKTKEISNYQALKKVYEFEIRFGVSSPSYDVDTEIDKKCEYKHITHSLLSQTINEFLGEQTQIPPKYSAKRIKGKRAYDLAREGKDFELKPIKIFIYEIKILEENLPEKVKLKAVVSKGTYVRALARDIAEKMQSCGLIESLRRTQIGNYKVEEALKIEDFEAQLKEEFKN